MVEFLIPYARHYKPRLVYLFTPFPKTIYVLWPFALWMACIRERLLIKSGLWWRAYGNDLSLGFDSIFVHNLKPLSLTLKGVYCCLSVYFSAHFCTEKHARGQWHDTHTNSTEPFKLHWVLGLCGFHLCWFHFCTCFKYYRDI